VGSLPGGPFKAQFGGEGQEGALVVVLAAAGDLLDVAGVGEGVDGLVQDGFQGVAGAFGQALASDEQLRPPPCPGQV